MMQYGIDLAYGDDWIFDCQTYEEAIELAKKHLGGKKSPMKCACWNEDD
jgi:hypothetical protein